MPRVPSYDEFQVAPTALPMARVTSPDMANPAGQHLQQIGAAAIGLGAAGIGIAQDRSDELTRQAKQREMEANALRVDDALNQAREAAMRLTYDKDGGFLQLKGKQAMERPGGKALADEFGDTLREQIGTIAGGLSNDAQRQAFQLRSGDLLTSFRGQAIRHETEEFRGYAMSVHDGTLKLNLQDAALNYGDPSKMGQLTASSRAAVFEQAKLLGKSASWAEAQAKEMTSAIHASALTRALEVNSLDYAREYLNKFSDQMTENDSMRIRRVITTGMEQRQGMELATEVIGSARRTIEPTTMDRVVNITGALDPEKLVSITASTESGNRSFDKAGRLVTSPVGAQGKMQVMPATAANPGHGIRPLRTDGTPQEIEEDRIRVGRELLGALLRKYKGDPAKMWAAYNAGEKWVDRAIAEADKDVRTSAFRGGPPPDDLWFQKLNSDGRLASNREQTKAYVEKNMAALNGGGGKPQRETLDQVQQRVRAQAAARGFSPEATRNALDEAARQYGVLDKAVAQRRQEALGQAMRELANNGGRFAQLSPATRAALDPQDVDNALAFGERIASGSDKTDEAVHFQLLTHPERLKGMSDAEFFTMSRHLSSADFAQQARVRADLISGKSAQQADDVNQGAITGALSVRLRSIGIDPTPSDKDTKALAYIGTINKVMRDRVFAEQQRRGRKLTEMEIEEQVDRAFAQHQAFNRTSWYGSTSVTSERVLTMKAGDIPDNVRNAIKADFKRRGMEATDADIEATYKGMKLSQR